MPGHAARLPSPDRPPAPSLCQQQLPATGVPITHQRFDQMRDMFDDYVRTRTLHNWKFWVVSSLSRWGGGLTGQAGAPSCAQGKGLKFCPLLLVLQHPGGRSAP